VGERSVNQLIWLLYCYCLRLHTHLTLIIAVWGHLDIDTAVVMNPSDPLGEPCSEQEWPKLHFEWKCCFQISSTIVSFFLSPCDPSGYCLFIMRISPLRVPSSGFKHPFELTGPHENENFYWCFRKLFWKEKKGMQLWISYIELEQTTADAFWKRKVAHQHP
jgi:hypothetical protein